MEIFKNIPGKEGYQVSNLGRVKSLKFGKVRILKQNVTNSGYLGCCLGFVHRLMAQAFIPNPEGKATVNHKNGIKTDNRIKNLEWHSAKENTNHAIENGLLKVQGEDNPMYGKAHSWEAREKMSKARTGSKRSEITKARMRRAQQKLAEAHRKRNEIHKLIPTYA